jgi:hypothetical protein
MENLIRLDISKIPKEVLKILLKDRSTKKNILWGTDNYKDVDRQLPMDDLMENDSDKVFGFESDLEAHKQIKLKTILDEQLDILRPRVMKSDKTKAGRTKNKAEVFTPSWICNKMNNYLDDDWFGRENVFNVAEDKKWCTNNDKIQFSGDDDWKKYIESTRLEITCGEAPYIASRYDTTTGDVIPIFDRIGMLDRKLRVVKENCVTKAEWYEWALKSLKSVYGYEYQGDNLLIARINVFMTFVEHYEYKFGAFIEGIPMDILKEASEIVSWNFWQMDGLMECCLDGSEVHIKDWTKTRSIKYRSIKDETQKGKKVKK